ncbi:glutamine amidotransferase [Endozoicomonas montiporae]|uniref:Glutamine amidotransferase n=2 Tax=Endozoicomonas montiporae TaxID=1027273 RepID=A0A081NAT8_9GAMM|nr:class II glutamine amidotransferase [Endozoicomonas montiporae]AMO56743.1 glutamine amidotransferase [Endozoicomonas montiporae CL-33]KEQ15561.1 glutamine amidotransferase [Endozoicomonas montiporae]
MCELLGMSANTPTDICFSFTGLMQRGGRTGPHRDGWGIAFYEGAGVREFRDPYPSCDSEIANLVRNYPIKSDIVISHIRQANAGRVSLENTHPFTRELWGKNWTFAHNGQLKGIKKYKLSHYLPVGTTDSEHAFCWLMGTIRERFPKPPKRASTLQRFIHQQCHELRKLGVFNMLLTDSKYLYCYCTTKLSWITRKAPFDQACLKDAELTVDFDQLTTKTDIVTVIATEPLTTNEDWNRMQEGEMTVFRLGEKVYCHCESLPS